MKWPSIPSRPNLLLFEKIFCEFHRKEISELYEALACRDLVPMEWVLHRDYARHPLNTDNPLFLSALDTMREAELIMREKINVDFEWYLEIPFGEVYSETSHWFGDDMAQRLFELGVFLKPHRNMRYLLSNQSMRVSLNASI